MEERRVFCDTILSPHARKTITGADKAIRERYARELPPVLSPETVAALNSVASHYVAYRLVFYDALEHYVMSGAHLGRSIRAPGVKGDSGNLSKGLKPRERAAWGGAKVVTIEYFLDFDVYPMLGQAHARLLEARQSLQRAVGAAQRTDRR
jgi:hypothetical protein